MTRLVLCLAVFAVAQPAPGGVKVDNEFAHATQATQLPHVKGAIHRHEGNRVMIYLDAADIDVTTEDGRVDHQHWKPGDVAWAPAGVRHSSENVGAQPARVVEVELRRPAPVGPRTVSPKLDPIVLDPAHNQLLLENAQVRVFRSRLESGATELMHEHAGAGRLVVLLTPIEGTVKSADGSTPLRAAEGDVLWSGPVTHATTNTGTSRAEMIVVEVK